jgi:exosome complex component RRP42
LIVQIEHDFVVDASMEEEFCSDGQLLVAVNGDGNICGIQRLGSSAVEPEMITEMLEVYLAFFEFETNFPLF